MQHPVHSADVFNYYFCPEIMSRYNFDVAAGFFLHRTSMQQEQNEAGVGWLGCAKLFAVLVV